MFRSTRQVAKLLDVTSSRLSKAVWDGRLNAPQRGPSGAFLWTQDDVRHASWVLLRRDFDGFEERQQSGAQGTNAGIDH